jgi:hypothetical protein
MLHYCRLLYIFVFIKSIIMSSDLLKIAQLKKRFGKLDYFTSTDLKRFYNSQELFVSDEAFRARIHRLIKMSVLQKIGHGAYCLGEKIIFIPTITPHTKKIFTAIDNQFPYANTSIWHTSALNEFMIHQPFRFQLIVEVEKEAAESIFYFLREHFKNVYLNPNAEIYEHYITGKKNSIIVKSMVSESPTQDIYQVITPTIEKILVDIYCDKVIYAAFQGKEMQHIYKNVFHNYTVNQSKLLRYAFRRGKKEEIVAFLERLELGMQHTNL